MQEREASRVLRAENAAFKEDVARLASVNQKLLAEMAVLKGMTSFRVVTLLRQPPKNRRRELTAYVRPHRRKQLLRKLRTCVPAPSDSGAQWSCSQIAILHGWVQSATIGQFVFWLVITQWLHQARGASLTYLLNVSMLKVNALSLNVGTV